MQQKLELERFAYPVHSKYISLSITHNIFNPFYSGEWFKDKKQGLGIMKYLDGSIYKGKWFENTRQGAGVLLYANGDIYKGEFAAGKKHGAGTYTFSKLQSNVRLHLYQLGEFINTTHQYQGNWETGKILQGSYVMPDGIVYKGTFENNIPEGEACEIVYPTLSNGKATVQQGSLKNEHWNGSFDLQSQSS